MDRTWFPARNTNDTPVALIKNFAFYRNLPLAFETIETDGRNRADFPGFSLATFMELFNKWNIKYNPVKFGKERIKEISEPAILFTHHPGKPSQQGEFIMFYSCANETVEYIHPRRGWQIEPLAEFEGRFGGVGIFAEGGAGGDSHYEEKNKNYEARKHANPELKNIQVVEDFLTQEECDYIIELAQPHFKRSEFLVGDKRILDERRTSYSAELHIYPDDKLLENIRQRAAKLLNIPVNHFEYFQCVSYDKTQEIDCHYDTFDRGSEGGKKIIAEGGQRLFTLLVYLNDDFIGGETYFPNLDILIKPKKGRVLIFKNIDENGNNLRAAWHAGLPVASGRKYAVNIWVRDKAFRN